MNLLRIRIRSIDFLLLMAGWIVICGCDAFTSSSPPPPTKEERAAIQREAERRRAAARSEGTDVERQVVANARAGATGPSLGSTDSPSTTNASDSSPMAQAREQRTKSRTGSKSAIKPSQQRVQPHTEWTLEQTAGDALGRIGPAAVPYLVQRLHDEPPEARCQIAEILARIGPDASAAVPALMELLRDPNPTVQRTAARALGQIGPAASDAVPTLLDMFIKSASSEPSATRTAPSNPSGSYYRRTDPSNASPTANPTPDAFVPETDARDSADIEQTK